MTPTPQTATRDLDFDGLIRLCNRVATTVNSNAQAAALGEEALNRPEQGANERHMYKCEKNEELTQSQCQLVH